MAGVVGRELNGIKIAWNGCIKVYISGFVRWWLPCRLHCCGHVVGGNTPCPSKCMQMTCRMNEIVGLQGNNEVHSGGVIFVHWYIILCLMLYSM